MNERIRRPWFVTSLAAASLMAFAMGAGIVAADPQQKKAPAASKKTPAAAEKTDQAVTTASGSVRPDEPIVARVNGEAITYKALAEECISRRGKEVLDRMISKMLVMQAARQHGVKVTALEIDEEIGRTAQRMNISREELLRILQNERDISYKQYVDEIVMPGLALKKLAKPYVKVAEEDIERGFEAHYGEKVQCRWITFEALPIAMKVWNELKSSDKDGDGKIELAEFERQVTLFSSDVNTRSIGGQLQPISRNTSPVFQEIEKAAFALKEDGEISKVVQFGQMYVILYREKGIPAADVKIENVRAQLEDEIYDAKLRDQIGRIFQDLEKNANIENLLTGDVHKPEKTIPASAEQPAKPSTPAAPGDAKPANAGRK